MLGIILQNSLVAEMIKGMVQISDGKTYRLHTGPVYQIHTKSHNEPEHEKIRIKNNLFS